MEFDLCRCIDWLWLKVQMFTTWILWLRLSVFNLVVLGCCTFCQGSHKPLIVLYALKTLRIGSWFLKKQEKKNMDTDTLESIFLWCNTLLWMCPFAQSRFFFHSIARFHWSLSSNFQPDLFWIPDLSRRHRVGVSWMWCEHTQTWLHSDLPFHQSVLLYLYLIAQRHLGLVIVHI